MNQQQRYDSYEDYLSKIIAGKFCKHCKTFSDSNCVLCRRCGREF